MILLIYLVLFSNLSIFIRGVNTKNPNNAIESDPMEKLKILIERFIEFGASDNAADSSVLDISLNENGYISETPLWIVWKGIHQKNQTVAVKIYLNIDNFENYEKENYWLNELGAYNPEIESREILRAYTFGVFSIYYRAIALTLFEETLEERWMKQNKQNKKISELSILLIFKRGVEILKYFSEKNVLHNDIKPSNILLHGEEIFICGFIYASKPNTFTTIEKRGTPEFASSYWYRNDIRSDFDDLESLVFSLWHVAGVPRDKTIIPRSEIPEGKTLNECLKTDVGRVGERAVKKMVEKSEHFKNQHVRQAMTQICSIEMLNRYEKLNHQKIINILDKAINDIHGNSETQPQFEWLNSE